MEIETKEEVHILTYFESTATFAQWEKIVRSSMSGLKNNEQKFGAQFIVDEQDELVGVKEEMLLAPLSLSLAEAVAIVNSLGGLCIASHIDRPAYSIISHLGFIPQNLPLSAVEITGLTNAKTFIEENKSVAKFPIITNSDAHYMETFINGPKTVFTLQHPSLQEICRAFDNQDGRGWFAKY